MYLVGTSAPFGAPTPRPTAPAMITLTLPQAQSRLRDLPVDLSREPDQSVRITEDGKEVMVVLSSERYQSLQETAEVRSDAALIDAIQRGVRDLQDGRGIDWEEIKRELGG